MISKDSNNFSEIDSLIMNSLLTLDQDLTSREETLAPFWTQHSKAISRSLLSPIKTASSALDSSSWRRSSKKVAAESWFSIRETHLHNKSSSQTLSASSLASRVESMDSEAIQLKTLSEEQRSLKAMRFRLFPTEKEKEQMLLMMEQWRWYYNFAVDTFYARKSYAKLRDAMREYQYVPHEESQELNPELPFYKCMQTIRVDGQKKYFQPEWWKTVNTRVIRGAIFNLVANIRSAYTNKFRGHNNGFNMKYRASKKDGLLIFEDFCFPALLKKIKGYYGYRTRDHRRVSVSISDVLRETKERGCTFTYEKLTDRFYLLFPVEANYYPPDDRRHENQVSRPRRDFVGLDPGVRKFLFGFTSETQQVVVGQGARMRLSKLLLSVDAEKDPVKKAFVWRKIKNLVDDLHWKTIHYLTSTYGAVILGDIGVSSIMRGKLAPKVKRILQQYSFCKFKTRLIWKCALRDTKCLFVNEAYTSKGCCNCGALNNVGASETFRCASCNVCLDRDLNSAINMVIKGFTLAS